MRQNVLHRLSWHVLCLLLLLLSAGCGGCGGGAGTGKVLIKLNWYPEAEHGGYYAAVVKHLYQDQGLDVEILRGGDQVDVPGLVASGQAAFGVANADDVLLARAQGRPVVAVMAPLQKGPQCIMVHKESGITRFDQLHGLTLAVERQAPYFKYLERKVDLTGVKVVPYSGGVSRFLEDPKYAQQGYVFSEPILVRKAKGSAERNAGTRCLMLYEVGYNPYTSALFTTESLIKDNP